ncbi:phospholipid phosphatase 2-like [Branchiostoma floridae]|uniref:Phospholipid phosphatase 2-like n=1 Tax=Branchiostoma floridae TaxID=7739 RepID=A0A9J7LV59_BRAFL|nr:phospholipid phosphatase 2-like [Branchiostoma floridae]
MVASARTWLLMIIDLICIPIAILPAAILIWCDIHPNESGFYCTDRRISYPYRAGSWAHRILGHWGFLIAMSIIAFVLGELTLYLKEKRSLNDRGSADQQEYSDILTNFFVRLFKNNVIFLFGLSAVASVVYVAKYTVGELRPYFLQVCDLNFTCTTDRGLLFPSVCTGDKYTMEQSKLGFVSGHAASHFYTAVYLAVYIQARWKWRGPWLVKPAVQAAFVAFAVWNSYTRVAIYHHDIYEVNRGIALGVSFAVIMVLFVSDLFWDRGTAAARARSWHVATVGTPFSEDD